MVIAQEHNPTPPLTPAVCSYSTDSCCHGDCTRVQPYATCDPNCCSSSTDSCCHGKLYQSYAHRRKKVAKQSKVGPEIATPTRPTPTQEPSTSKTTATQSRAHNCSDPPKYSRLQLIKDIEGCRTGSMVHHFVRWKNLPRHNATSQKETVAKVVSFVPLVGGGRVGSYVCLCWLLRGRRQQHFCALKRIPHRAAHSLRFLRSELQDEVILKGADLPREQAVIREESYCGLHGVRQIIDVAQENKMCVRDVITLFTVVAFSQDSHGILELSNIAVGIRGAAKFVCPVRNYQLVIWREYVSHAMGTVIVHGSKIVKSKRMKRYQTPTTPYSHELYIPTAMPEDAGLYSCQSETNTTEYFGQLLLFSKFGS
ncbi:hypothetical protein LSAT2_022968 [Lamellibrachia satsuma]|nr:hypothetical protein LSAT2_022968 [Lamellibrachia satsuma]